MLPPVSSSSLPPLNLTCHVTRHRHPVSSRMRPKPETELADRRCAGLNMNYSIIFTEISVYPRSRMRIHGQVTGQVRGVDSNLKGSYKHDSLFHSPDLAKLNQNCHELSELFVTDFLL